MGEREVDQALVERVQRGDKKAFDLLVLKYQQKVANLVSRYIRDPGETLDVTQEAFIKAYRALGNFRGESAFYPGFTVLPSIQRKITWLPRHAGRRAPTWMPKPPNSWMSEPGSGSTTPRKTTCFRKNWRRRWRRR